MNSNPYKAPNDFPESREKPTRPAALARMFRTLLVCVAIIFVVQIAAAIYFCTNPGVNDTLSLQICLLSLLPTSCTIILADYFIPSFREMLSETSLFLHYYPLYQACGQGPYSGFWDDVRIGCIAELGNALWHNRAAALRSRRVPLLACPGVWALAAGLIKRTCRSGGDEDTELQELTFSSYRRTPLLAYDVGRGLLAESIARATERHR